tara:strand:- start:43 stop:1755 length:1713 start_codon:yes stop_codon:yes gene_type:complete
MSNDLLELRSINNPNLQGKEGVLEGYALVFGKPSSPLHDPRRGQFVEVLSRRCLDNCNLDDVSLLLNHDEDGIPLARTTSKTLELEVNDKGLYFRAKLGKSERALEIMESVELGNLNQMSFAYFSHEEDIEYFERKNQPLLRQVNAIDEIFEISIVTRAAFGLDTSVKLRGKKMTTEDAFTSEAESELTEQVMDSIDEGLSDEQFEELTEQIAEVRAEQKKIAQRQKLSDLKAAAYAGGTKKEKTEFDDACEAIAGGEMQHRTITMPVKEMEKRALQLSSNWQNDEVFQQLAVTKDIENRVSGLMTRINVDGKVTMPMSVASPEAGIVGETSAFTSVEPTAGSAAIDPKKFSAHSQYSVELASQSAFDLQASIVAFHNRAHSNALNSQLVKASSGLSDSLMDHATDNQLPIDNTKFALLEVGGTTWNAAKVLDCLALSKAEGVFPYQQNTAFLMGYDTYWGIVAQAVSGDAPTFFSDRQRNNSIEGGMYQSLFGYPVVLTDSADLEGTNAGEIFFGDFRSACTLGTVDTMTMTIDPYTNASTGIINVTSFQQHDLAIVDNKALVRLQMSG